MMSCTEITGDGIYHVRSLLGILLIYLGTMATDNEVHIPKSTHVVSF